MPANIEIKAHISDFERLQKLAAQLSEAPCQIIPQVDTFFNCPHGRIKLRELSADHGQLIYYQRADIAGPKHSEYQIFETTNPAGLKSILSDAYGIRGVVTKTRHLYLVGQTRIHLDVVEGLGTFLELEVVLQPGQTDAEGQQIAHQLMHQLGIEDGDLIDAAYMDLVEK
ncbi:MAG TPA: class IV adenylate cyclase [Anaerolineales bacterium]